MVLGAIKLRFDAAKVYHNKVVFIGVSIWSGAIPIVEDSVTNSVSVFYGISRSALYGLPLRENVKDWLVHAHKECK